MRTLLLALLLLVAGCGCVSVPTVPTHDALRSLALRLEFGREAVCSGTAISSDTLITAQHCLRLGGPLRKVNGQPVKVVGIGRDKSDTLTIRVTGVVFKHWAQLGPAPKQGDGVQWFGNPAGQSDVYRIGYVMRVGSGEIWLDARGFGGDSGAGLMDKQGRLVGVISGLRLWRDRLGNTFSAVVVYCPGA